ncbi:cupin domain-containing protein [Acidobacteria bacterium AB60]|nr:cupin domain-containing protein [Acidobacteria bacterium AB60]
MDQPERSRVLSLAAAKRNLPGPNGEHAVTVLRRGSLDVALSMPRHPIQQAPHAQDEIYCVLRGRGIFFHNGNREPVEAGDLVFVAAGSEHQFESCSDGFTVWRVFYGPPGGELPE